MGFVINGDAIADQLGRSVAEAGDINGDGIADLVIGAPRVVAGRNTDAGRSFVVIGRRPDRVFVDRFETD